MHYLYVFLVSLMLTYVLFGIVAFILVLYADPLSCAVCTPDPSESASSDAWCSDWFDDVRAFHLKFGTPVHSLPTIPTKSVIEFRQRLNEEEDEELYAAIQAGDLPEIADALVDGIYVRLGMALAFGIDVRPVWEAVHEANMQKVGGARRADGKILKPEGWTHPDVVKILADQEPITPNSVDVCKTKAA